MRVKGTLSAVLILSLFCSDGFVIGFQTLEEPTASVWSISDPETEVPKLRFSGDIAATGGCGEANPYVLRVNWTNTTVVPEVTTILSSVSGSGVPETWSNTVPEPSGGWQIPSGLSQIHVVLELRVSGNIIDSSEIMLVP